MLTFVHAWTLSTFLSVGLLISQNVRIILLTLAYVTKPFFHLFCFAIRNGEHYFVLLCALMHIYNKARLDLKSIQHKIKT